MAGIRFRVGNKIKLKVGSDVLRRYPHYHGIVGIIDAILSLNGNSIQRAVIRFPDGFIIRGVLHTEIDLT